MDNDICERLKKELSKKHECYVLITCGKPNSNGDMDVNFSYGGDADLASYLIQGAQSYMDEEEERTPAYC